MIVRTTRRCHRISGAHLSLHIGKLHPPSAPARSARHALPPFSHPSHSHQNPLVACPAHHPSPCSPAATSTTSPPRMFKPWPLCSKAALRRPWRDKRTLSAAASAAPMFHVCPMDNSMACHKVKARLPSWIIGAIPPPASCPSPSSTPSRVPTKRCSVRVLYAYFGRRVVVV